MINMVEFYYNSSRCRECGRLMLYANKYAICNECMDKRKVSSCKVIDLLNKIANGEELPKTIMFRNYIYYLGKDNNYHDDCYDEYCDDSLFFLDDNNVKDFLNEQVEILKEKGDNNDN